MLSNFKFYGSLLIFIVISLLVLLYFSIPEALNSVKKHSASTDKINELQKSEILSSLIHEFQQERRQSAKYLDESDSNPSILNKQRIASNIVLQKYITITTEDVISNELYILRNKIDKRGLTSVESNKGYTIIIEKLMESFRIIIYGAVLPEIKSILLDRYWIIANEE